MDDGNGGCVAGDLDVSLVGADRLAGIEVGSVVEDHAGTVAYCGGEEMLRDRSGGKKSSAGRDDNAGSGGYGGFRYLRYVKRGLWLLLGFLSVGSRQEGDESDKHEGATNSLRNHGFFFLLHSSNSEF